MPYIIPEQRPKMGHAINRLIEAVQQVEGDQIGCLNFVIYTFLIRYFELAQKPRYRKAVEALGTLDCVSKELYRRHIADYEDQKCCENGDCL